MNIILAVREHINAEIDEQRAEIGRAEADLAEMRDKLHILEDLRTAARMPDGEIVDDVAGVGAARPNGDGGGGPSRPADDPPSHTPERKPRQVAA